jgi:hypothetical protein
MNRQLVILRRSMTLLWALIRPTEAVFSDFITPCGV